MSANPISRLYFVANSAGTARQSSRNVSSIVRAIAIVLLTVLNFSISERCFARLAERSPGPNEFEQTQFEQTQFEQTQFEQTEATGDNLTNAVETGQAAGISSPTWMRGRLVAIAIAAGELLLCLIILFAYLKLNHATRGFYGGRLQILALIAALACLSLGYIAWNQWVTQ